MSTCSPLQGSYQQVDELDTHEGGDDSSDTIHEDVLEEQSHGARRFEGDPSHGQGNQKRDYHSVEDEGGKHSTVEAQAQNVQGLEGRESGSEHHGENGEVLRHIVGYAKCSHGPARHQQLLPQEHHFDYFRRVGLEVNHVGSLLGCLGPRIHRQAYVGHSEGRGVVRPVSYHRDHQILSLLLPYDGVLVLRLGLGNKLVNAHFVCNALCCEWLVPGDHHRADSHGLHCFYLLLGSRLEDILQSNQSRDLMVARHGHGGIPVGGDAFDP